MEAMGAIVAAIIAGFIGYIGLIANKENEISKFRHAWIELFRNEAARLSQLLIEIPPYHQTVTAMIGKKNLSQDEIRLHEQAESIASQINMSKHMIILRINSKKERRTPTENDLIGILMELHPKTYIPLNEAEELAQKILSYTGDIIHDEWGKIKKGSIAYILSTIFLILFFIASLTFTIVYFFHHNLT